MISGTNRIAVCFQTASVIYAPAFAVSVTGFGDSLTLASGICRETADEALVARILELTVGEVSTATD